MTRSHSWTKGSPTPHQSDKIWTISLHKRPTSSPIVFYNKSKPVLRSQHIDPRKPSGKPMAHTLLQPKICSSYFQHPSNRLAYPGEASSRARQEATGGTYQWETKPTTVYCRCTPRVQNQVSIKRSLRHPSLTGKVSLKRCKTRIRGCYRDSNEMIFKWRER